MLLTERCHCSQHSDWFNDVVLTSRTFYIEYPFKIKLLYHQVSARLQEAKASLNATVPAVLNPSEDNKATYILGLITLNPQQRPQAADPGQAAHQPT